jgi:hypothetical protein
MDGLSAEVRLLAAPARLEGDGESPIYGNVVLTGFWDGRPMRCDFSSEQAYDALPSIQPTRLEIIDMAQNSIAVIKVDKPLSTGLILTVFGDEFQASLVAQGESVRVSYDREDDTVKEVVAHLLNVPQYKDTVIAAMVNTYSRSIAMPARLCFTGGGWRIKIDSLLFRATVAVSGLSDEEDAEDQLWQNRYKALTQVQHTGGTLVTHGLRLERANGAIFGLDRAAKIVDRLETFLSFVFGRRTRPLYASGYDVHGSQKWALLDVRPPLPASSSPPFTPSWLPQVSSLTNWSDAAYSAVDLSSAFEGFMSLARDPNTLTILTRAIGWYEAALAFFGRPASVVLAQAGLELLAWRRITAEMKLPQSSIERIDVTDQLRLLLSGTELTLDIPVDLPELSKAKSSGKRLSGPDAVTRARNAVVHPRDNSNLTKEQAVEAQSLALWYFEMLLLRMIGYNGEYWDRLSKENRFVPWR